MRPDFWSVHKIGSRPILALAVDLSSHSASQQAGLAGINFSGGVRRQTGPAFIVMMRPVFGLKPILNSPLLSSALVPEGA